MRVLSILRMDHPSIEYVPCVPILGTLLAQFVHAFFSITSAEFLALPE